jgi:TIR domain-containing protein
MSYRVFISFARKDKKVADSVAHQVRDAGAEVVAAESVVEGAEIKLRIGDAMRQSDEIIMIVSKDSAQSAWLNYEIGAAVALGKRITPILVRVEPSELPPVLRSVEGVKLENVNRYVKQLSQAVQSGAAE